MIVYCTYVRVYSKRGGLHITNNNSIIINKADVIDIGQLVTIKRHKTATDTDSVTLQPQNSYWHRNF